MTGLLLWMNHLSDITILKLKRWKHNPPQKLKVVPSAATVLLSVLDVEGRELLLQAIITEN